MRRAIVSEQSLIAFAGDSLTAGGDWGRWFPEDRVENHGRAGDTTEGLIARIDDVVANSPDVIVLLIGTNDLAWHLSVERIVRNIETILATLRKRMSRAQILIQSVLPREAEFAAAVREINRHLWQFAPVVRAQYLDLWPVLATAGCVLNPAYTIDGLHLTDEGYEAWLSELRPAVEAVRGLPPASRSLILPRGRVA